MVKCMSGVHSEILSIYNSQNPLPVGCRMTSDDDWCDATVTAAFKKSGLSHLVGGECGDQRHIAIFKPRNLDCKSLQAGASSPLTGTAAGTADHIGIVESVSGLIRLTTIEVTQVLRQRFADVLTLGTTGKSGYARPQYSSTSASTTASCKVCCGIAQEVINGQWGSGEDRRTGYLPLVTTTT